MTPPRHGRLWLLGALSGALSPALLRLPPWFAAYCVALLAWRLFIDLSGRARPPRRVHLPLTLAGIGAVLFAYRSLFGPDPSLALLAVMLCLKLLEMRTMRDAMLTTFLGWFLVAGGFLVIEQTIFSGAWLLVTVFLLTAALVALNHPATQARPPRFYLRIAGTMLFQALPIMTLLFLLFPRLPEPLWSIPQATGIGRTGMSDHMSLGSITRLAESEAVAFRVQFDGPIPPADTLYWRGPVLWISDGRRWDPIRHEAQPAWFREQPLHEPQGKEIRYSLTLEPYDERWLFALELPPVAPHGLFLTSDFQLFLPRKASTRQRFQLTAHSRYRAGSLTALPEEQRRAALQLPAERNPQSLALARSWSSLPPREIVHAALALFRNQPFWYTRTPPPLGAEAIDDFLFVTRRGFCEHYAAAFVTLMRGAGVPARLVTGYQGGELNPLADYLIVRQSHAHAWAEVWLEKEGWQRVDPTAMIPLERVERQADLQRFSSTAPALLNLKQSRLARALSHLRYGWDALNNGWNQWVLGYNYFRQQELLSRLGLARFGWQGVAGAMFGALALVLGAIFCSLQRQGRSKADPVADLYEVYCRRLARIGINRAPHEGPAVFAQRAAQTRPDLAFAIDEISDLYIGLRYGHAEHDSALPRLQAAVRRFRPENLRLLKGS